MTSPSSGRVILFLILSANSCVHSSVSHLGIRTPLSQRMLSAPKGWEPRIYCRGTSRDLSTQALCMALSNFGFTFKLPELLNSSEIHLSSKTDRSTVLQAGKRNLRNRLVASHFLSMEGETLGIELPL